LGGSTDLSACFFFPVKSFTHLSLPQAGQVLQTPTYVQIYSWGHPS